MWLFFLKVAVAVVVVIAAGAALAGISMDLRSVQSTVLLWKTYPVVVAGKISRYVHLKTHLCFQEFLHHLKAIRVWTLFSHYTLWCYFAFQDFMRQAGEVTYADAHKERTNEGVIEFRSYSDMKRALDKLDGTDINGRKIRLVEDRPRKRRSYSGSHSR